MSEGCSVQRCSWASDGVSRSAARQPTIVARSNMFWSPASARILWIRGNIVLHLQIVEHIEIGVQLVVPLQCLQIANRGSRLNRRPESSRPCPNPFPHEELPLSPDANPPHSPT